MAPSWHVAQNKRGRDEYLNGGLALTVAKRTKSVRLVHDRDLMALLEMIDNMDAINSNPEEAYTAIQVEDERQNGATNSLEDEVRWEGQADHVESVDVDEMGGSIKQIIDWNPEVTSSSNGDMHSQGNLTYYDDARAEIGFFVDHTAVELGIIMNLLNGDSMPNMYSDAVYGYTETVYESLREDNIWQLNEHPVIQNDFESRESKKNLESGTKIHHV